MFQRTAVGLEVDADGGRHASYGDGIEHGSRCRNLRQLVLLYPQDRNGGHRGSNGKLTTVTQHLGGNRFDTGLPAERSGRQNRRFIRQSQGDSISQIQRDIARKLITQGVANQVVTTPSLLLLRILQHRLQPAGLGGLPIHQHRNPFVIRHSQSSCSY